MVMDGNKEMAGATISMDGDREDRNRKKVD
jgi:hypothetical protein